MAQLSGLQVAQLAYGVGVGMVHLPTCVAIAWAESGLRTDAIGINPGPRPGTVASRDRGLWQINDYYHPDVSDACAFNAECNAQAMFRISNGGTNWHPWSTFNSGAFYRYLAAAQLAVHLLQEGASGGPIPSGGQPAPGSSQSAVDAMLASVRRGSSPLSAVVSFIQAVVNNMVTHKYGPSADAGPVFGNFVR